MSAPDALLSELAQAAGLQSVWRDAHGHDQTVAPDTLRAVLQALGLSCETPSQCRASLEGLDPSNDAPGENRLSIVRPDVPLILKGPGSLHYRLQHEDGARILGTARDLGGGRAVIDAIRRPGYYLLEIGGRQSTVAVVTRRAPDVQTLLRRGPAGRHASVEPSLAGPGPARAWVLGVQVYGLQRGLHATDAGAGRRGAVPAGWETGGDFSLVGALAQEAAQQGAAGLAISPVHAMFSADPARYSPYAPSSRLFLNSLYADPAAVLGDDMMRALLPASGALALDAAGCMDWPAIHALRLAQLRRLFDAFEAARPPGCAEDFEAFRQSGGEALASHACYEALHASFLPRSGAAHGWQDWPSEYHDPNGQAVTRFARAHEQEVRFHVFLQWLAARSLAHAQARAAACMPLGLIADMAVGTDPRGSHAWCRQDQIMTDVTVGAPPDVFQSAGQDWGLTAFSPRGLRRHGYGGFIETVRAVLAQAGGLRVDHVMGLARMWLVPRGARAAEGVYLKYPFEDMMDLLMLEAWRHDALVVGENLGTVPEGFDEALEKRGFLGMSVLWFEREAGEPVRFRPPPQWPVQTMAMAGTHDLPTLRGWWAGRDIDWRVRQGDYDESLAAERRRGREDEKRGLWSALQEAGMVAPGAPLPKKAPTAALLAYVASTPAVLLTVALEDLAGREEQSNLPGGPPAGAPEQHPNWRRMLDLPVQALLRQGDAPRLLQAVRQARACNGFEAGPT